MNQPASKPSRRSFSFSNLQVLLMLLVAGVGLIAVTWVFAVDIGRVPISLWDICTTAVSTATDAKQ